MVVVFGRRISSWRLIFGATTLLLIVSWLLFPGQRLGLAFTLGTGIGRHSLQARIDALEQRAVSRAAFSEEDREFLSDFYRTLATGAKVSILVRQTGLLMDHYLDGSGAEYRLDPSIFRENDKVRAQADALRLRAAALRCKAGTELTSPDFYMPDQSKIDSIFGLYWGHLSLRREPKADGSCLAKFRAEVPWRWPSYPELAQKYGTPHAERFPLPNLASLLLDRKHSLYVGNGLGEFLAQLQLAKPFVAFAEWAE